MKVFTSVLSRSVRGVGKLCLPLFLLAFVFGLTNAAAFAAPRQTVVPQRSPVTVITSSLQASDNAMNSGDVVNHPNLVGVNPASLLSPAQLSLSSSPDGQFLYNYILSRVQVMRTWEARHSHDASTNHVWSTFKVTSTSTQGSLVTVTGAESFHVDTTVKSTGTLPTMSPRKRADFLLAQRTGIGYVAAGQINHGLALIQHTITLRSTPSGLVIESDRYQDALEPGFLPDHHTQVKGFSAPAATANTRKPYTQTGFTYYRQAAINYADRYWGTCPTPGYNCYGGSGGDCANFVSQSIYDGNGGNLPGDNTWYSVNHNTSNTFVNAPMLQSYMAANFAYSYQNDQNYSNAYNTEVYAQGRGDLVFYSWDSGPIIDHTTISVAYLSDGSTVVDSHTAYEYHFYWDMAGGTVATYWHVQLYDSH